MRAADLDFRELLEFDPAGGVLSFGGARALLFDALALGMLRAELIESLGLTAARGLLTRFGYAHGYRTAEAMQRAFPWDDAGEWRRAGGRLHTLQGLVIVEPIFRPGDAHAPFAESLFHDSYEAEQHLAHFGRSHEPVCWTLVGFASGYLSFCNGRKIYCIEERCKGRGDAVCSVVGRHLDEWGDAIAPHLPFYEESRLDPALLRTTEALKRMEARMHKRQNEPKSPEAELRSSGLVAHSEAMQRVLEMTRRVAQYDSSVLITGESGVGKERIARLLHDGSARVKRPFVAVNCGALPENLLESELFGHVKGAFTGASHDRAGLFEAAQGGTLFLDEVGELPSPLQVKLLRALQEREIRRVGENHHRKVDVRVVAASHRALFGDAARGKFREDLYYRLRVVEIDVPPLRERRDDILPLARVLLARAAERTGLKVTSFSAEAANQLVRHPWPGNVRELENAMERAVVLARGTRVDVVDLPEEVRAAKKPSRTKVRSLAEVEREHILSVLEVHDGHRERAAEQLGIGIATLYRKLKQYEG